MRIVFVVTFLLSVFSVSAQTILSEGAITFDLFNKVEGKKNDTIGTFIQMVKGVHYRSDLVSSVGKITTIYDVREGNGAILRDLGLQKIMTRLTQDNWREIHNKFSTLDYTIAADTIHLLGYTCNKATATLSDGSSLEIFFTDQLVPENNEMFIQFGKIPGLVLKFSSSREGTIISYEAKSISLDPVQIQQFDIPLSGYRLMNFEESKK